MTFRQDSRATINLSDETRKFIAHASILSFQRELLRSSMSGIIVHKFMNEI